MSWTALTVVWSKGAVKDVRGLVAKELSQIESAVSTFAATGTGDIKKLQGDDGYRIAVRGRRVMCKIAFSNHTLTVMQVILRGEAYGKK